MSSFLLIAQERGQDPALVAPGLGAFLVFFVLALVCAFLGFSMTRRVRRSQYRNAERARTAAAESGFESDDEGTGPSTVTGPEGAERPRDEIDPSDPHHRGG